VKWSALVQLEDLGRRRIGEQNMNTPLRELERHVAKATMADSMGRCNGPTLYDRMEGTSSGKSEARSEHGAAI
jgi:hypothetical protein